MLVPESTDRFPREYRKVWSLLSATERRVIELTFDYPTDEQIAAAMGIGVDTVRDRRKSIDAKFEKAGWQIWSENRGSRIRRHMKLYAAICGASTEGLDL